MKKPKRKAKINEKSLFEIRDNRGHFKRYNNVNINSYPKRSVVYAYLSTLTGFSLKTGFELYQVSYTSSNDEYYYFISKRYVRKLCKWLSEPDNYPTVISLSVDNSDLFGLGTNRTQVLKKDDLCSKSDYLDQTTWNNLIKWFGGGFELKISDIEGKGKLLRVVCSLDIKKFRRFYFSENDIMKNVKKEICEIFQIDKAKTRIHDFFRGRFYDQLDAIGVLEEPLKHKQLVHDNILYLELPNISGLYEIKVVDFTFSLNVKKRTIWAFSRLQNVRLITLSRIKLDSSILSLIINSLSKSKERRSISFKHCSMNARSLLLFKEFGDLFESVNLIKVRFIDQESLITYVQGLKFLFEVDYIRNFGIEYVISFDTTKEILQKISIQSSLKLQLAIFERTLCKCKIANLKKCGWSYIDNVDRNFLSGILFVKENLMYDPNRNNKISVKNSEFIFS